MNDPSGLSRPCLRVFPDPDSGLWAVERSGRGLELGVSFVCFLEDFLRFIPAQALFSCELEGLEP